MDNPHEPFRILGYSLPHVTTDKNELNAILKREVGHLNSNLVREP